MCRWFRLFADRRRTRLAESRPGRRLPIRHLGRLRCRLSLLFRDLPDGTPERTALRSSPLLRAGGAERHDRVRKQRGPRGRHTVVVRPRHGPLLRVLLLVPGAGRRLHLHGSGLRLPAGDPGDGHAGDGRGHGPDGDAAGTRSQQPLRAGGRGRVQSVTDGDLNRYSSWQTDSVIRVL